MAPRGHKREASSKRPISLPVRGGRHISVGKGRSPGTDGGGVAPVGRRKTPRGGDEEPDRGKAGSKVAPIPGVRGERRSSPGRGRHPTPYPGGGVTGADERLVGGTRRRRGWIGSGEGLRTGVTFVGKPNSTTSFPSETLSSREREIEAPRRTQGRGGYVLGERRFRIAVRTWIRSKTTSRPDLGRPTLGNVTIN